MAVLAANGKLFFIGTQTRDPAKRSRGWTMELRGILQRLDFLFDFAQSAKLRR
jgi:hypothetical protein